MSINFPSNPAGQTPTNTFSPTSTPSATSNGITYIYDGTKWTTDSSGGGGGGSQDLQSVTDEGNTTTNGATFADGDIELNSSGSITAAGDVKIGGLSSAPNITLNAGGNAEFVGRGRFGDTSTGYTGPAVSGYSNTSTANSGVLQAKQFGTGALFAGFDSIGNNTASIMADGSATFDGTVTSGGVNASQAQGLDVFTGSLSGQSGATSIISADGIAVFASGNFEVTSSGSTKIRTSVGTSAISIFPSDNFSDPASISLETTGKARFDDEVSVGGNISVGPAGLLKIQAGVDTNPVFQAFNSGVYSSSNKNIEFLANGTATFLPGTGEVVIGEDGYFRNSRLGQYCWMNADINSIGAVAFGTAPVNDASNPSFYVDKNGTIVSRGGTSGHLFRGKDGAIGADRIIFEDNGNGRFDGTLTATVVPPSDARFKENITPAKPQLADVVALGGLLKNYDWNDDAPLNEELRSVRQLGLIAQEVAEVCPSIVKDINRTKTMEVTPAVTGPKGRVITEAVTQEVDDSYKGLSQEALIMKLIGAVSELSAKVDLLKAAAS